MSESQVLLISPLSSEQHGRFQHLGHHGSLFSLIVFILIAIVARKAHEHPLMRHHQVEAESHLHLYLITLSRVLTDNSFFAYLLPSLSLLLLPLPSSSTSWSNSSSPSVLYGCDEGGALSLSILLAFFASWEDPLIY